VTDRTSPVHSLFERVAHRGLVAPLRMAARIAVVMMCLATLMDVAGRHFLGLPVSGIVELAELALVWSAFTGIAIAFWSGAHVSVELIELLVPRAVLAILDLANALIVFAVIALLAVLAVGELIDKLSWGDRTMDLAMPYTWHWGAVVTGYAAATIFVAVRAAALRHRPPSV
jgi:TRAP-type C4-dicarboxylate transport system permease small subunit